MYMKFISSFALVLIHVSIYCHFNDIITKYMWLVYLISTTRQCGPSLQGFCCCFHRGVHGAWLVYLAGAWFLAKLQNELVNLASTGLFQSQPL